MHCEILNLCAHTKCSYTRGPLTQWSQVDIAVPEIFVGGLLGSMLIFLFSAWACSAVGKTAQEVVNEVRRQFIERPGIMVSTWYS